MSFNNKYNTRNSGRFNTGHFVPGGELIPGAAPRPPPRAAPQQPVGARPQQPMHQQHQQQNAPLAPPPPPPSGYAPLPQRNQNNQINQNLQLIQTQDVEMKPEPQLAEAGDGSGPQRPFWMKNKLAGVRKILNKERRRRQNESLRRLLTPKNALMVLNEMMPNKQITNQFKVEPATPFGSTQALNKPSQGYGFCADIAVDGTTYKGYGDNKMTARNAAAEQAIRDLIIKKMNKITGAEGAADPAPANPPAAATGGPPTAAPAPAPATPPVVMEGCEAAEGEEEPPLPMIQLASFALHKLFAEWEYEGHKVPQLKPSAAGHPGLLGLDRLTLEGGQALEGGAGAGGPAGGTSPPPRPPQTPKVKKLPLNAAAMHPCMLLTYMRPHMEYRELAVEGDRPQNMCFTMGVDVDGATYIGKAPSKKEARKQAAKSACQALFSVTFDDVSTATAPVPAQ